MARKKSKLTPKTKELIKEKWHQLPFRDFDGAALKYLKTVRTKSMKRIAISKAEATEQRNKEQRSIDYYRKNPLIVNGKKIPVDSLTFQFYMTEAKALNTTPRALAKEVTRDKDTSTYSISARSKNILNSVSDGDTVFLNGKKSSKAAVKKRMSQIFHAANNVASGFDMSVAFDYDKAGNIYFNLPTVSELNEADSFEAFEELMDEYDDLMTQTSAGDDN